MEANGQQWERNVRRRILAEFPLQPPPPLPRELYCCLCSVLCNGMDQWQDHMNGYKHRKRRKAWLARQWEGVCLCGRCWQRVPDGAGP